MLCNYLFRTKLSTKYVTLYQKYQRSVGIGYIGREYIYIYTSNTCIYITIKSIYIYIYIYTHTHLYARYIAAILMVYLLIMLIAASLLPHPVSRIQTSDDSNNETPSAQDKRADSGV